MRTVPRHAATFVAAFLMLFAWASLGHATQPRSPITVTLSLSQVPSLNAPATATITVVSTRDAPGTTVELLLPQGSSASATNWTVNLLADRPVTLTSTFTIRRLGNATVSARARKMFAADNAWGDMKSIPLTIRSNSLMPLQGGGASQFGWSVDTLPRATQIVPGTARVVSTAPIPFAWPRNITPMAKSALPRTAPNFRLPPGPVVPYAGAVTLTGSWYYTDRNNVQRPIDQQLLEIRKGDGSQMSPAQYCFTDANGAYSCSFDSASNGNSFIVLVRSWTNLGDRLGVFSGSETAGGCGSDSIDCSYSVGTPAISCASGQSCSVGGYVVNSGVGDPWLGAIWMTQDMIQVWKRLWSDTGAHAGPGRISFPVPSGHGTHAHVPPADGWIAIEAPAHTSAHPPTHEYGHVVMANKWASFGITWPPFDCGSSHDIPDATGPGCAMSEGWADFWSAYGTGNPAYLYTAGGAISNFETRSGYRAWASGDWVEGNVAAVMWDMYDASNDGPSNGLKDRLTDGIAKIWTTLTNNGANSFSGWWTLYQNLGYSACPALEIIQYNTISYSLGACPNYTITTTAGTGGTATGGGTYMNGTSITVSATPSSGNSFINWTVNGSSVSTSANYTFNVNSSRNLVANFAYPATMTSPTPSSALLGSSVTFNWNSGNGVTSYGLNVGTSPGDNSYYAYSGTAQSVNVTGLPVDGRTIYVRLFSLINGTYQYRDYTYTAATAAVMTTPAPGSTLSSSSVSFGWSAGVSVTDYFLNISNNSDRSDGAWYYGSLGTNRSVTVSGLPTDGRILYVRLYSKINGTYVWTDTYYSAYTQTYTISLSASPVGGGSVSGAGTFAGGSSRTVTANASSGYTFKNWTENGSVVSTSASYTFTLNGNRNLVANFAQNFTISVSASPAAGGTVGGAGTFAGGSSRTVTASANSGYTFTNWTENGSVVSSSASYTFTLNSNRNLVANFVQNYTIVVSASPAAGGAVGGAGIFAGGSSRTVTASANSGYTFANWTENGSVVSTSASYTFTLNGNRTLVANFTTNKGGTTATVSVAPNPSSYGQAVSFKVTVAAVAPASGTPTGSVTFMDGSTTLGTRTLSNGKAALNAAKLAVGNHSITAVYGGDANFASSTSSAVTQTVNKGATTVTASASPGTVAPNAAVTLQAQVNVTSPAVATPAGHVTFKEKNVTLGSGTVASGVAEITINPIPIGSHTITAIYSGDSHLATSSGATSFTVSAALGPEARVNSTLPNSQQLPAVAALTSGYVVVWASNGQDGSGYGIYAQRYTGVGGKTGGEFLVNTVKTGAQTRPAVAGLSDGGFIVVWQSAGEDGSGYGIYGQRHTATGAKAGAAFRVNPTTAGDQTLPAVAAFPDGGFVIAWTSNGQDGSGLGVYARRYDATGKAQGAQFRVNARTVGDQSGPSIAALTGGGFVIAWQSADEDGSGLGVYGRRYDPAGKAQGNVFKVNTVTVNDQSLPSVAPLDNGGFVIAWQSALQDGAGLGVYAQRYSATGVRAGGETRINTTTVDDQGTPRVAGFSNGGYVVVWASKNQDGSGQGVYAQGYKDNGVKANVEFRVNTTTALDQYQPVAAGFASGRFVAVWTSQNGSVSDIYVQRFALPGTR